MSNARDFQAADAGDRRGVWAGRSPPRRGTSPRATFLPATPGFLTRIGEEGMLSPDGRRPSPRHHNFCPIVRLSQHTNDELGEAERMIGA